MILTWRWYDPFMWLAFWLFARNLEDRCDEAVIASMQQQQRRLRHDQRAVGVWRDQRQRTDQAHHELPPCAQMGHLSWHVRPVRRGVCLLTVPDYSSRAEVIGRFERIMPQDSRFSTAELDDAMNDAAAEFHKYFDGCTLRSLTYDEVFSASYLDGSSDDPQRTDKEDKQHRVQQRHIRTAHLSFSPFSMMAKIF